MDWFDLLAVQGTQMQSSTHVMGFPGGTGVKNLPATRETQV